MIQPYISWSAVKKGFETFWYDKAQEMRKNDYS